MPRKLYFCIALAGFFSGCVTAPPKPTPSVVSAPLPVPFVVPPPGAVTRMSALVRLSPEDVPVFEDDFDTASLRQAAAQSLSYYQNLPDNQLFVISHDTYTAKDMAESMAALINLLENPSSKDWLSTVRTDFVVYQSVGVDQEKTVTFSSYYEPVIPARLQSDRIYKFPFYSRPSDLIDVDLGLFDAGSQGGRIAGRRKGRALVPYSTRADIDSAKALQGQGLELAWAKDPLDVLDMQIEGSGWLDVSETRDEGRGTSSHHPHASSLVPRPSSLLRIRYDGDNGRRYKSVGQNLITTGRIPSGEFSRRVFRQYLSSHPSERQALLNVNERYIFFRIDKSSASVFAYGDIEVPLTPGRSIATDPKLFPKGALAWIDTTRAVVGSNDEAKGRTPLKRFMLTQDEGGAIQGPGRVDVFAGHGQDAAQFATHLWDRGKLYFLVKKKT